MPLLRKTLVTEWFERTYPRPTPPQLGAWPRIEAGRSVLIVSPTGTGKTFAAFLAVLNDLALRAQEGSLPDSIHALYVSPLRALGYDLEKNLQAPLEKIYGAQAPIRVGLRSGDTGASERRKQFTRPPHILLTTPESLSILLTQPKWLPHLRTVRWVIVDEIHALSESKRGAHLSLSLERLQQLGEQSTPPAGFQRIGLSATVAPVAEAAQFLVGTGRACEVVDVSTSKKVALRVHSPLGKNPYPPAGFTGIRLIRELARLITLNTTTLVFTNTRSGAEAATFWLHQALPGLSSRIECHHASLDRDVRQDVEDRLKRGELKAVICSTSLELGIDIGSLDLVVMLSTPKGVSRALQRAGRAGHSLRAVSRGVLMATNLNDLVESCATVLQARARQLDPIRLPRAPLDVLAQHVASMCCLQRWAREDAWALVRRAYPYRALARGDFNDVLDYLAGGGKALRRQYSELFGKIILDETGFETRPGLVRRDLLQNMGVIPNEGSVRVKLRGRTIGTVEEMFVRQLAPGDVFTIAGRPVRLSRVTLMECFVERAGRETPTVPRWNANKMPLGNKVAEAIVKFRGELRARLTDAADGAGDVSGAGRPALNALTDWVARRLDCGGVNARLILRMYLAQYRLSDIPTADFLLIEEFLAAPGQETAPSQQASRKSRGAPPQRHPLNAGVRHYFFHSLIGRAANDALSRVVALRLSRLRGGNAVATPDDYGFVLTVAPAQMFTADELPQLLTPENLESDLHLALSKSELLQYHFRTAAQTGLMVYRNYFGEQKPVRKVQWSTEVIFRVLQEHEPDHVLLREARRDAIHTYLDVDGALGFLRAVAGKPKRLAQVARVPPLSFAMYATRIKEALMVEDPRETMERLFHLWWERLKGTGDDCEWT